MTIVASLFVIDNYWRYKLINIHCNEKTLYEEAIWRTVIPKYNLFFFFILHFLFSVFHDRRFDISELRGLRVKNKRRFFSATKNVMFRALRHGSCDAIRYDCYHFFFSFSSFFFLHQILIF